MLKLLFLYQERLKIPFAVIDTNDDGIINYEEFRKFYELRNQNPNTTRVSRNKSSWVDDLSQISKQKLPNNRIFPEWRGFL